MISNATIGAFSRYSFSFLHKTSIFLNHFAARPYSRTFGPYLATQSRFSNYRLTATMPTSNTNGKRKASSAAATNGQTNKKSKTDFSDRTRYKDSTLEIKHGIVMREFYPPEMTNSRATQYASGKIERPIETLQKAIKETRAERETVNVGQSVVHWFKTDLRTQDNRGLSMAAEMAKKNSVPLVGLYVVSPQDWEAHLAAPVRVDFLLRTLAVLQKDLEQLDIPLWIETVEKRRNVPSKVIELCEQWGANHVFCNIEYEVDELRREAKITRQCLENGIAFSAVPDTCVVEPGTITSGTGNQMAVYTPWHRRWCAHLNAHPKELTEAPPPGQNPASVRKSKTFASLFSCDFPEAPKAKSLSAEDKKRFAAMWPAGEHEAMARLRKFIKERVGKYADARNLPAKNGTSTLSPHLAAGTIAARTCVRLAQEAAPTKNIADDKKHGHSMWISEVAWRDFYRHVMVHWPFICMNKSFKPEYSNIKWSYNLDHFNAWTHGRTGFPIVDAAMRQLLHTGYMHNRARMVVASFLAKDLLIDWRMGERWFMEHLVDGDFASNNGGWGFSASCGVDPQPYFRIFNPLLQSEKFDPDGEYIRKWVDELKDVKGKAVHDPYARGQAALVAKKGYPKPIVDHKVGREKALKVYKEGIGRETT